MEDLLQRLKKPDAVETNNEQVEIMAAHHARVVDRTLRGLNLYICNMADPITRQRVNDQLTTIPYRTFIDYYANGNRLSAYSISKELDRMKFSVIHHGQTLTDVGSIVALYESQPYATVWRLANQSIYADILIALQKHFVRPDLSISISATSSSFIIDMDVNTVRAESSFLIVTVKDTSGNERLELGSVDGIVFVDLTEECVEQSIQSPSMRFVFDEDMHRAAEAIVELGSIVDDDNYDHNPSKAMPCTTSKFSGFIALANTGSTLLRTLTHETGSSTSSSTLPRHTVDPPEVVRTDGGTGSMAGKLTERVVFSLGSMLMADVQHPAENIDQGFKSLLAGLKNNNNEAGTPALMAQQSLATPTGLAGAYDRVQHSDEWDEW